MVLHNLITSRAVPEVVEARRRARGPDPGRPLLHQGRDGQHRGGLRRRALRALLLPGLLRRRLRACSPRCTCWPRSVARPTGTTLSLAGRRATTATPAAARSTPPSADAAAATGACSTDVQAGPEDGRAGPPRRHDGLRRSTARWWFNLRVVQHRAAAPAQRGGRRRGHHGPGARPCAVGRPRRRAHARRSCDEHPAPSSPGCARSCAARPAAARCSTSPATTAQPGLRCSGDAPGRVPAGRTYRFDGGVPVLLVDEGVLPAGDA